MRFSSILFLACVFLMGSLQPALAATMTYGDAPAVVAKKETKLGKLVSKADMAGQKVKQKIQKAFAPVPSILDKDWKFFGLIFLICFLAAVTLSVISAVAGVYVFSLLAWPIYLIGAVCFWIAVLKLAEVIP